MGKNKPRQATDDNIIRRLRIAYWIIEDIISHSEYVVLTASPQQQWLRKRFSGVTLYVHCVSCYLCFMAGVLVQIQVKKSAGFPKDRNNIYKNSPISLLLNRSNKVTVHNLSLRCTFPIFYCHLLYGVSPAVSLSSSLFYRNSLYRSIYHTNCAYFMHCPSRP